MSASNPENESANQNDHPIVESQAPPQQYENSATSRFRQEVASKQGSPGDDDIEKELWAGGYSPKAMVGSWVMLTVVSIALLLAALLGPLPPLVAVGAILVTCLLVGLTYLWRRLGVHYQLTTQRFIHRTGILTRKTDRIEVIDIDDVSFTKGPIQRALGVGTITLTVSDRTHPELALLGIDTVEQVASLIDDIRRQERRSRSLHIESI